MHVPIKRPARVERATTGVNMMYVEMEEGVWANGVESWIAGKC